MKQVTIYTDGSCLGNEDSSKKSPGGYAAIAIYTDDKDKSHQRIANGGLLDTTNNRAEMVACIEGLRLLKERCCVIIVTDSDLIVKTMTKGWKRNANIDLWSMLDEQNIKHKITWQWVKGHAGDLYNEAVNSMAISEASLAAIGKVLEYGSKEQPNAEDQDLFSGDS